MSHAEDASSVPGMYIWRLPTTCNQLQQFQLLVLVSTGTCCTRVAYTHIDTDTDMQIKEQENPPKSTSQKAVWRVLLVGLFLWARQSCYHTLFSISASSEIFLTPQKEKAPILLCCGLSSWRMTSKSSASWGVRTICLPFLGVGTTASGKQALLPCLLGVTGGNWQFPSQHSTHLKSFSLSFQESLQSKIQLKSMRQEQTGYPQCQTRRGLLSKNPLAQDGKAHREYSSC